MRIEGVDRVPVTPSIGRQTVIQPVLTDIQKKTRRAKRLLAARGLMEAVTWSFVRQDDAEHFGGGQPAVQLANPISTDMSTMRPSLLPGLLRNVQANVDRGTRDVALFEVGQVFAGDAPEDQTIAACGVRRGTAVMAGQGRHWVGDFPAVSAFNAKADALSGPRRFGFGCIHAADRCRRPGLVPSRPIGHDPARQASVRPFRHLASTSLESDGHRRPRGRI